MKTVISEPVITYRPVAIHHVIINPVIQNHVMLKSGLFCKGGEHGGFKK